MLSSATRKLRFWKKRSDKKKEVTTEDEALLGEIEHQRRIINNLKQECARLKELKTDLEQYKLRFELLDRRTAHQARSVEKQQSKLQTSLKMAEEEIERLSEELRVTKTSSCEGCQVKTHEQKKYSMEISYLQDTVIRLEKENGVLQSLVREYALQASRTKSQSCFSRNLSSQTSIKSNPDALQTLPLGKDPVRRSSLSLNDFLDDNIDIDVQSEKFEVEKSSGCSSLDEERKESISTNDSFVDGYSSEFTPQTSLKDNTNSEASLSADERHRLPTIENLIEKSKTLEHSEIISCTSDKFILTNHGSVHEFPSTNISTTDMMPLSHEIFKKSEIIDYSRSLKNLSRFSEQETIMSKRQSSSCPSIYLDVSFYKYQPFEDIKTIKRRSLEDQKTLAKIYLNNKVCQTDLQKAVNFFRAIETDDGSNSEQDKHFVITKDKVAALREYFEGKKSSSSKKLKPVSSFKNSHKSKRPSDTKPGSPQMMMMMMPKVDLRHSQPEASKKLCFIPRLNGFRRITKTKVEQSTSVESPQKPTSPSEVPQQPRDVRSASVPSPVLPSKCKESPQFKIAFMKSTSLRSFNHLPLNRPPRIETKAIEAQPSEPTIKQRKIISNQKQKVPFKSPIIENLDKYKLNLNVTRRNTSAYPLKRSPVLMVDVSEDISDAYMSNDETPVEDSTLIGKKVESKPIISPGRSPIHQKEKLVKFNNTKVPSKSNQAASCQCRSKAFTNKESNLSKVVQIRTNGSVPHEITTKRSTIDKSKPHEPPCELSRLVQRDDAETNQTFFYEVQSRKLGSSIPIKIAPKNSPRSNRPSSAATGYSFSNEKFILKQDQTSYQRVQPRKPPPHLSLPQELPSQRSDELPRPLNRSPQERDGKTHLQGKSFVSRPQNKSTDRKKINQATQDKHWSQCAKTNSNKNSGDLRGCELSVEREIKTSFDKTTPLRGGTSSFLAKQPSRTNGPNYDNRGDEFKEISRQLDKLNTSESGHKS